MTGVEVPDDFGVAGVPGSDHTDDLSAATFFFTGCTTELVGLEVVPEPLDPGRWRRFRTASAEASIVASGSSVSISEVAGELTPRPWEPDAMMNPGSKRYQPRSPVPLSML